MISINVLSFFYVNRLDFRDTHQMKDYPNVLQTWNINVAVKITLISYMDIISTNLLFFRRKLEFTKLHTNGTDFYANCKWWKKFQREEHCRNCLVMLNFSHNDWEWTISAELSMGMEVCSSIGLSDYTCTHVTSDSSYG